MRRLILIALSVFRRVVRAGSCRCSTTVLGPGLDSMHDGHLHLCRLKDGSRICQ